MSLDFFYDTFWWKFELLWIEYYNHNIIAYLSFNIDDSLCDMGLSIFESIGLKKKSW